MTGESNPHEIAHLGGQRVEVVQRYSDGTAWVRYLDGPKHGSRTVMQRSLHSAGTYPQSDTR